MPAGFPVRPALVCFRAYPGMLALARGLALAPGMFTCDRGYLFTVIRPVGVKPAMSLSIWRTAALSAVYAPGDTAFA